MKLPPAKRNQLLGVILATAGLIGAVYFLLIQPQNQKNASLGQQIVKETDRLGQVKKSIKEMNDTTGTLAELARQLSLAEADIASGDLYAWTVDTMRRFKAGYRVDIPTTGQPGLGDCDLIGNFPYKQIRFTLNGTAYYHDLGRFVSDFENKFPHCRVLNLNLDPVGTGPGGSEKLNFQMDIVALVKPSN
jgi:hypothetical protein